MIGVLMSSTLPARLGEPSRALIVARRTGRPRENLPVVLGTVVSQTVLNIVALIDPRRGHVLVGRLLRRPPECAADRGDRAGRAARIRDHCADHPALRLGHRTLLPCCQGAAAARSARWAACASVSSSSASRGWALAATVTQLSAWALQCVSCYFLLIALGLGNRTGFAAAAAVLFAVNITAVVPVTPANLGVFQAACATVLRDRLAHQLGHGCRLRRDPAGGRGRRPRSCWVCRRCCGRECPGARSGCARCTRRRSSCPRGPARSPSAWARWTRLLDVLKRLCRVGDR